MAMREYLCAHELVHTQLTGAAQRVNWGGGCRVRIGMAASRVLCAYGKHTLSDCPSIGYTHRSVQPEPQLIKHISQTQ